MLDEAEEVIYYFNYIGFSFLLGVVVNTLILIQLKIHY